MDWIKAHKKQLILIGISIPTIIAIVLGLKNKDAMMELLDNLKDEVEKANLYSSRWFEKATDAELNAAREKVRRILRNSLLAMEMSPFVFCKLFHNRFILINIQMSPYISCISPPSALS